MATVFTELSPPMRGFGYPSCSKCMTPHVHIGWQQGGWAAAGTCPGHRRARLLQPTFHQLLPPGITAAQQPRETPLRHPPAPPPPTHRSPPPPPSAPPATPTTPARPLTPTPVPPRSPAESSCAK